MADLPIGFRFYPTEEELVSFYLRMKLQGRLLPELSRVIPDVDIYDLEPWHLPKLAGEVCQSDTEQWFFFTRRQEREARGGRPSRTTGLGYWKATGSPSYVYSSDNRVIGVQKAMVFYNGKAPAGKRTKWKMHEYRAIEFEVTTSDLNTTTSVVPKLRHEFSLSRVFVVSGSFRAFDRRPLGTAAREDTNRQPAAAATSAAAAQIMEKTTSSPESSYSGGGGGEGAEAPPHDFQWDWGQLDWVCPSQSRGANPEEMGTYDENSFVFGG